MFKVLGSVSAGFGTYWLFQSGVILEKPKVDRAQALLGTGAVGMGLYLVGKTSGFNHGYRIGTQQVIRYHNDCRKADRSKK